MTTLARAALLAAIIVAASVRAEDKPNSPPPGYSALFNGKNLDGWKSTSKKTDGWAAEDGAIVCKGGGGGYLITEKEYGDFEFQCEYKWSAEGGNSGVAIRTPEKGDPAYVGMEIQLIDD
ncbi:MAG TPA: DUF1080 domain-containing protein, partial [Gemmataceae bacterium]